MEPQDTGPRTTATSAAEGRLKVGVTGRASNIKKHTARKGQLKEIINKFKKV